MVEVAPEIVALCQKVTAKRPKTVLDHILKHGFITTEDLQQRYGYDHPPRAIRDVRDHGIPLETFSLKSERTGRRIGAYRFGDPDSIKHGRIGGRKAFSTAFRKALLARYDSREAITGEQLDPRYLQIDHRIPYAIAGDENHATADLTEYMLLDASSQRAKSWSCEHCANWSQQKDPDICRECFWAFPENYSHVAMVRQRRVEIVWQNDEALTHDLFAKHCSERGLSPRRMIKDLVSDYLRKQRRLRRSID